VIRAHQPDGHELLVAGRWQDYLAGCARGLFPVDGVSKRLFLQFFKRSHVGKRASER